MSGFLYIDKPAGITSHDVVDHVRRLSGERTVGHAGTLDPFATGLLIVGVGRSATKQLSSLMGSDKAYLGTLVFGATSDTQDGTGRVEPVSGAVIPTEEQVRAALPRFMGTIKQVPPMYSAKKIAGKKLYELARAGQTVKRQPVEITITHFDPVAFEPPRFTFAVRCSSGTYIRTLAHDLGQTLRCGAYLESLRRTAIGAVSVHEATKLEDLTKENWSGRLIAVGR